MWRVSVTIFVKNGLYQRQIRFESCPRSYDWNLEFERKGCNTHGVSSKMEKCLQWNQSEKILSWVPSVLSSICSKKQCWPAIKIKQNYEVEQVSYLEEYTWHVPIRASEYMICHSTHFHLIQLNFILNCIFIYVK